MTDPATISGAAIAAPSFWWAEPGATLLAALAAGIFAYIQIGAARQMTRLKSSLDLIERTETKGFYQNMRRQFKKAAAKNFENLSEKERIGSLYLLNHYELIAIGCYESVLDKKFYQNWMRSVVVKDWRLAESFIWTLRHPANKPPLSQLFVTFERLAKEWEREIISQNQPQ